MPFKIIRNDITKVKADAIVNTANPHPTYAAGTDAAIYKAAGAELQCDSIAFPLIATGVYGFPKDRALQIAVSVISRFLLSHDMQVILVVFDRHSFELSGKLFRDVDDFIDENYVARQRKEEYLYPDQSFDGEPDAAEIAKRSRRLRLAENRRILSDSDQSAPEMMEPVNCAESEAQYPRTWKRCAGSR